MSDLPAGTVTLLFTDIEGSTRLLQQLGKRYSDVLAGCRNLLRTAFQQWNGHEVDTQGDAFFVAFARATDAVSAAVEAQRALAIQSWPEGVVVRVRIGIHTGEPQHTAEGYTGLDVHHAARIMSAAHAGQTLLSQTTRDLAEHDLPDGVFLRDLGEHRLKDLQRPGHLYQVISADLPDDFPPIKTVDSQPNNLPAQLTRFIGRAQEVATVMHLFHQQGARLLTLTGPGGTGKTRLALQVATELSDRFPDGVFFVNLAPISDPAFVIATIAQTLELKESSERSLLDLLKMYLRDKQLLLLLDNFEQVVKAAPQVSDLLAACPQLHALVTSREVLHVRGEQEFAVPPLDVPDPTRLPDLATLSQYEAVTLFILRAQAIKPDFQVTNANAPAVAEICVRLDGLPLAIELAAARSKLLPPQALLARLDKRLAVLAGGAQDVPARQQTLRNTIEWSYHLLAADEQKLFRRLSVCVGGCTLDAIEAVCIDNTLVLDGIASLLDKNLLYQKEQSNGEPRLMMLETIREFGLECLLESGEENHTRDAHAAYYLRAIEEMAPKLIGKESLRWLEQVEWEHDNIRGALNWLIERKQSEQALRLSSALWRFWMTRGYVGEGLTFLERGIEKKKVKESVRAKALNVAADLLLTLDNFDRAAVFCQESLQLYQHLEEKHGIATSLCLLGVVSQHKGKTDAAQVLLNESLTLFRELGDTGGVAEVLGNMAHLAFYQGDYTRAFALAEKSLAFFKEANDKWNIANMFTVLLNMTSYRGIYTGSETLAKESLAIHRELGDKIGIAAALSTQGAVLLNQGEYAKARLFLEDGLAIYRELDFKKGIASILFGLGRVAFGQDDYAMAEILHLESLVLKREVDFQWGIALGLEELGAVVAMQGCSHWAARLVGAAAAMRETFRLPPEPVERTNYERGIAHARTLLGEEVFAKAVAEGRTMTPEQAIAAREPATMPAVSSAKSPSTYPDGLTAREVEVLCLIAQGLTDAQIAERLIISPRTVNTHVTSIYGKIPVSSRSAATRYAIEHHLQ